MTDPGRAALDRLEIHELRAAYSRALDFENYERAFEVFTEDATVYYRNRTCESAQEVYEYWRDAVEYEYSQHTVQLPEIELDGDEATGKWYMLVFYHATDGSEGAVMGWYEDQYRRVDGDWKVAEMDMEVQYDTGGYHT